MNVGELPEWLTGINAPLKTITCKQDGRWQAAYIPIYQSQLQALDDKSKAAVIIYLVQPDQITKKQRDLIFYLRSKNPPDLISKAKKIESVAMVCEFLRKFKPVT